MAPSRSKPFASRLPIGLHISTFARFSQRLASWVYLDRLARVERRASPIEYESRAFESRLYWIALVGISRTRARYRSNASAYCPRRAVSPLVVEDDGDLVVVV
jgi:hypothetical protein